MPKKQTSAPVASIASKILRDGRVGANTKAVAAIALSQKEPAKKPSKKR